MLLLIVLKYMAYGVGLVCAILIVSITHSDRLYSRFGRGFVRRLYWAALGATISAGMLWMAIRVLED